MKGAYDSRWAPQWQVDRGHATLVAVVLIICLQLSLSQVAVPLRHFGAWIALRNDCTTLMHLLCDPYHASVRSRNGSHMNTWYCMS